MHVHESPPTDSRGARRSLIRARLRRNRTVGVVVAALVGIGVILGSTGSASALPSAGDWLKLRNCESGGNYAINTGNGYYGAYQFDLGTWASVGGTGLPSNASPATQDALAYKLWQQRGWTPWTCARIVGLPVGGSGGSAVAAAPVERTVAFYDVARLTGDGAHLSVVGWAADLGTPSRTTSVRISVNSAVTVVRAASPRPDVNRVMHLSGAHGFSAVIPIAAGSYRVCVVALGTTAAHNASLGCRTVNVPPAASVKAWNRVTPGSAGRALVFGWVYDNAAPGRSDSVVVVVDNRSSFTVPANRASADVSAAFRVAGNHRYSTAVWVGVGRHVLCVTAIGVRPTSKRAMGCTAVNIPVPVGSVDRVTGSAGTIRLSGWGFDPNSSAASVKMMVAVNGVLHAVPANQRRADVDRVFHITGNHGFSAAVPARKGVNSVCVYVTGTTGIANRLLSCRGVAA